MGSQLPNVVKLGRVVRLELPRDIFSEKVVAFAAALVGLLANYGFLLLCLVGQPERFVGRAGEQSFGLFV